MKTSVKGVIVREVNYGESDKILTILTAEKGLISAIAKRCRNLKNKSGSVLQLFSYCCFYFYESKRGNIIDDYEPLEIFWGIRNDLQSLALCQYFCELTISLSPESPNSSDFLKLILNSFFYLSNKKKEADFIKSIFEMRALSLCGYIPNLVACDKCKEYNPEKIKFYIDKGIITCLKCSDSCLDGCVITPGVLSALRHIVYSKNEKLFSFSVSNESADILYFVCEKYVLFHMGSEFRSLNFYKSICQNNF